MTCWADPQPREAASALAAERDLDAIFAASEAQFGEIVADRYRRLVSAALQELRLDADRAGVQPDDSGAKLYHLRHSRRRPPRGQSIVRPRHLLAFRIIDGQIVVVRVVHDAMDLPEHLKDV